MKKIAVIVGARPQFIKLAPLVEELAGKAKLQIIHTGQHYDFEMSAIFFQQLELPRIDYHLGVGSATQGTQVGRMIIKIDEVLRAETPDMVAVIGDTNTTLSGSIAAAKSSIPLVHIEAGLRSKNSRLPEQVNRVVADRLSDILCCPCRSSVENLLREGRSDGVILTGDILYDLIERINPSPEFAERFLTRQGLKLGEYIYLTTHRAENVDQSSFLSALVDFIGGIDKSIFFPLHPRTEKNLRNFGQYDRLSSLANVILSKPVGISESLVLTRASIGVVTDSGGLQREAAFFGKKAYILRDETEWLELERCGAVTCLEVTNRHFDLTWLDDADPGENYFQKAALNIATAMLDFQ